MGIFFVVVEIYHNEQMCLLQSTGSVQNHEDLARGKTTFRIPDTFERDTTLPDALKPGLSEEGEF